MKTALDATSTGTLTSDEIDALFDLEVQFEDGREVMTPHADQTDWGCDGHTLGCDTYIGVLTCSRTACHFSATNCMM